MPKEAGVQRSSLTSAVTTSATIYIAPAIFGRRTPSAVDVELSCDEDVLLEAMECPQHDGTTARGRSTRATVRLNGVRMTDIRAAIGGRRRGILVRPQTRWSLTATDELD